MAFGAVAVALRVAVLALDHNPRFFLGDSESYLGTSFRGWIPPDRSWLYGLGVNAFLDAFHRLSATILVQSLLGAAMCAAAAILLRALHARRWVAWLVLLLLSADPLLLYSERSIMTDAPATATIWLGVVFTAFAMLRGGAWRWGAAVLCLWAAIGLRTALLPLVFFVPAYTFAVSAVQALRSGSTGRQRLVAVAGPACFGGAVVVGLVVYAMTTGWMTGARPSLNPKAGYFMLGVVAPILAPEDFIGLRVNDPESLLRETRHDDVDRRTDQIYGEAGLALRLEREMGDWQTVSRTGMVLFRRSIRRDPLGYGRLAGTIALDYVTPTSYRPDNLADPLGLARPLPEGMLALLRRKSLEPVDAGTPARPSLVLTWLQHWSGPMLLLAWLSFLMPVATLLLVRRPPEVQSVLRLLAGCSLVYVMSTVMLSTDFEPRYLLPCSPILLTLIGLVAGTRPAVSSD